MIARPWNVYIAGYKMGQEGQVRRPLDIGLTAQGIHAAPRQPHVAQQQLDHGHAAHVLRAHCMLGLPHGVEDGPGLVPGPRGGVQFIDRLQLVLGAAGDAGDRLERIPGVVTFMIWKTHCRFIRVSSRRGFPWGSI